MTLNRSFRKSQPVPDLFARQFLDQESDNAFFSFTHFMKDGGDFLRTLSAVLHIPSIPTVFEDRIKLFGFNWLFQKIKGGRGFKVRTAVSTSAYPVIMTTGS